MNDNAPIIHSSNEAIEELLRFETLLSDFCADFAGMMATEIDNQIPCWISRIVEFLKFDIGAVLMFSNDHPGIRLTHRSSIPGAFSTNELDLTKGFPWTSHLQENEEPISLQPNSNKLSDSENDYLVRNRFGSLLVIPLLVSEKPRGAVLLGSFQQKPELDGKLIHRLQLIGRVFGEALERQKTFADLNESERRLKSALNAAEMGVWEWNVPAARVTWVGNVAAIFGLAPGEFGGDLETLLNFTYPDDRDKINHVIDSIVHGAAAGLHFEYRIVRPDGIIRWIEGSGQAERDAAGKPLTVTGTVVDITARKQAEETIFNIERGVSSATGGTFFRSLVRHLAQAIPADMAFVGQRSADKPKVIQTIAVFADGQMMDNFEYQLTGAPCENVIGGHICCYPSCVQKEFPQDLALSRRNAESYVGTPLVDSRGQTLGLIAAISRTRMDNPELTKSKLQIFAARALAELERTIAEKALRESEERFRGIFEHAPIGMADVDTNLRMVKVNETLCQMLGYSMEELTGKTFPEITFPEDINKDLVLAGRLLKGEIQSYQLEKRYIKSNGEVMWGFLTAALFRDKDGKPIYGVGMLEDISERKEMEEQLRQSQKMEAIGQLAGGIAHDFNNLLIVINGYTDLSLGRLKDDDPIYKHLSEVRTAGERAASLTRQLLAFSRKQMLQLKLTDLNSVLADMEKMLCRLIGENINLTTVLGKDLKPVLADRVQMEQVILNLAVNARDAMPDGGQLIIETASVNLDEEYAHHHLSVKPGPYVRLAVTDTGEGIPSEIQQRIFDPFFTTKKAGKGTGLGLSTVYGIVKQMSGSISVDSSVGMGTIFTINLPAAQSGVSKQDGSTAPFRVPRGTGTILLAEDDEVVRHLIRVTLELAGYKVLEAADGATALAMCEQYSESIDLLLTDIVMPGMGGHELGHKFANLRPGVGILYMSGYTDDAALKHEIVTEGLEFIQKPFSPAALIAKIKSILSVQSESK